MKIKINYYLEFSHATKRNGTYQYEKTIATYLLMYFNNTAASEFNVKMLNDFILFLKANTKLANVSINKCIKLLRCIFRLNGDRLDWLENYQLLKERNGSFDLLSEEELKLTFNYVDNMNCRGNSYQYRLMMYLLYDTGIRQSEMLHIKLRDINLRNGCILIKARKSNADRHVFLSDRMIERLVEYFSTLLKEHDNNTVSELKILQYLDKDDLLFYNHLRERAFNRNDLKLFYRRLKKATGIKRIHSHMFRHTYATDLIELNVPLFVVQKQLGHASIKTTELYYHSSILYQKNEMLKISEIR